MQIFIFQTCVDRVAIASDWARRSSPITQTSQAQRRRRDPDDRRCDPRLQRHQRIVGAAERGLELLVLDPPEREPGAGADRHEGEGAGVHLVVFRFAFDELAARRFDRFAREAFAGVTV